MDDLHPPGQSSPDVPIIIQRLDFSHSDLISEVISDYRTSGAETSTNTCMYKKPGDPAGDAPGYLYGKSPMMYLDAPIYVRTHVCINEEHML